MKVIVIHEFDHTNNTYGVIGVTTSVKAAHAYTVDYYSSLENQEIDTDVEYPILFKLTAVVPDAFEGSANVEITFEEFEVEGDNA